MWLGQGTTELKEHDFSPFLIFKKNSNVEEKLHIYMITPIYSPPTLPVINILLHFLSLSPPHPPHMILCVSIIITNVIFAELL